MATNFNWGGNSGGDCSECAKLNETNSFTKLNTFSTIKTQYLQLESSTNIIELYLSDNQIKGANNLANRGDDSIAIWKNVKDLVNTKQNTIKFFDLSLASDFGWSERGQVYFTTRKDFNLDQIISATMYIKGGSGDKFSGNMPVVFLNNQSDSSNEIIVNNNSKQLNNLSDWFVRIKWSE